MSASQIYLASPIKRPRATKAEIEERRERFFEIVAGMRPMTVRQVFYQLVVRNVIDKTEEQYQGTVIRLLTEMRMADEIPFNWIIDESRRRIILRSFDNVADAVDDCAKFYRRNAMRESSVYMEIWTEKEALSGIISDEATGFGAALSLSSSSCRNR